MYKVLTFILLIIIVVVFSVQNAAPVAISFFFWRFEASLALVIFLSAFVGMILGALMVSLKKGMGLFSGRKAPGAKQS